MSQKKVDNYRAGKYGRSKASRKERIIDKLEILAWIAICLSLIHILTEDDVTYLWSRKTFDDEAAENAGETPELKELGKEKTYTVTQEDIGSKIVLTITGKEENGYSGTLKVTSDEVVDAETGAVLEAVAEAQAENPSEETGEDQTTDEENTDDQQDNADSTEDIDAAGTETVDEIPPRCV